MTDTCATCEHWWRPHATPDQFGTCSMVEDSQRQDLGVPWIGGEPQEVGPLHTPPDFGCTLHTVGVEIDSSRAALRRENRAMRHYIKVLENGGHPRHG